MDDEYSDKRLYPDITREEQKEVDDWHKELEAQKKEFEEIDL